MKSILFAVGSAADAHSYTRVELPPVIFGIAGIVLAAVVILAVIVKRKKR